MAKRNESKEEKEGVKAEKKRRNESREEKEGMKAGKR